MAIQDLPKAQWEILTKQTYEPVRQFQFVAIFVPPVNVANKVLQLGKGALSPDQQKYVGPSSEKPEFALFSTLRGAKIPDLTVQTATDKAQGTPVTYANRIDTLAQLTTQHREYQGWYAYRAIYEWNRQAYNQAKQQLGYQYNYKGGVIVFNTPTFEQDYNVDTTLFNVSSDSTTLISKIKWDECWVFVNAFPTTAPGPDFTYTGDAFLNYSVSWQYDRMLSTTDLREMSKKDATWSNEIPMSSLSTLVEQLAGNIQ